MTQTELLLKVKELLDKNNISFWLMGGTLLGAVRDKSFIKHDDKDIDIGLYSKDQWKVKELIENSEFKFKYCWRKEFAIHYGEEVHPHLDFFFHDIIDNSAHWYFYTPNQFDKIWNVENRLTISKKILEPLNTIEFLNTTFKVPNKTEEYLVNCYTENWTTINPDWHYSQIPAFEPDYQPITAIVPSFLRDECLAKLVTSFRKYYPKMPLIIGYQGKSQNPIIPDEYTKILELPYDCGLSCSRNSLVAEVKTPMTWLLDDDFIISPTANIYKMAEVFGADKNIGIVAGRFLQNNEIFPYEKLFEFSGDMLFGVYWEALHKAKLVHLYKYNRLEFGYADIVHNFFIAKTKILKKYTWDNRHKVHSVTEETPVIIKDGFNNIKIIPIENLMPQSYQTLKNKEWKVKGNISIWSDIGWQKIKYVSKHTVNKKMYKIKTVKGFIECSENHSLIINNKEVEPKTLKLNQTIEQLNFPKLNNEIKLNKYWAWFLGFFLAEGCYRKNYISISNQNLKHLKRCMKALNMFGIEYHLVDKKQRKDKCYQLQIHNTKIYAEYFRKFYTPNFKTKTIPNFLFKTDKKSRYNFINGFLNGDGYKKGRKYRHNYRTFSSKYLNVLQGISFLLSDFITHYWFNIDQNELGKWWVFNFSSSNFPSHKSVNIITKIESYNAIQIPLYDIETENHHFCGGIGNINLHNSEHLDFFLNLKINSNVKVAFIPNLTVIHDKQTNSVYKEHRTRQYYDLIYEKYGLRIGYSLGENNIFNYKENRLEKLP